MTQYILSLIVLILGILDTLEISYLTLKIGNTKKDRKSKEENNLRAIPKPQVEVKNLAGKKSQTGKKSLFKKSSITLRTEIKELEEVESLETILMRNKNIAVYYFALRELKLKYSQTGNRLLNISNYSFWLKLIIYQILLAAIPTTPKLQTIFFFILETIYLTIILSLLLSYRPFRRPCVVFGKLCHSILLFIFHLTSMIVLFGKDEEASFNFQQFRICCILLILFFDYLFVIVELCYIIFDLCSNSNKKRQSQQTNLYQEKKKPNRKALEDLDIPSESNVQNNLVVARS